MYSLFFVNLTAIPEFIFYLTPLVFIDFFYFYRILESVLMQSNRRTASSA